MSHPRTTAIGALLLGAFAALPAHAVLTGMGADHDHFLTSNDPFSQATPSDFNSGFFHYVNTETTTGGGDTTTGIQDVTVTANAISANLSSTTELGGAIAGSTFEARFTLTAPATAQFSGSAAGSNQAFSGGYSVLMKHATDSYANSLVGASGNSSTNWSQALGQPLALAAGLYDLKVTASISGGAVGTTFNNLLVQFSTSTGDYNGSGQVEQGDLDLVLQNWGLDTSTNGVPAGWTSGNTDLGQIEQTELDDVLQNWGSTTAPDFSAGGNAVPEPGALALLALTGLATLRRTA